MAKKFVIAKSYEMNGHNVVMDHQQVEEDFFWESVKTELKEIAVEKPEAYEEFFPQVESMLNRNKSVTIRAKCFQISGK